MPAAPDPPGLIPLPPPPERIAARWRRRWRALGAYTGVPHWLLVRGSPLAAGFLLLYLANGLVIGWTTAYDVTIGITSPGDPEKVSVPALAWPLSMAGWLAMPAIVGATIGITVEQAITGRRRRTLTEALGAPPGEPDA